MNRLFESRLTKFKAMNAVRLCCGKKMIPPDVIWITKEYKQGQDTISVKTLEMMDKSVENMRRGVDEETE